MLFDVLERRLLLTQLAVVGTGSADRIELTVAGLTEDGFDVRVRNAAQHVITVKVDAVSVTLAAGASIRSEQIKPGGVTEINAIDLGGGDDIVTADNDPFENDPHLTVPMTVNGGSGNDSILGGFGADQLNGGDGNDTLQGSLDEVFTGSDQNPIAHISDHRLDVLDGGIGNDRLRGDDYDQMLGGDGADTFTLFYTAGNGGSVNAGSGHDALTVDFISEFTTLASFTLPAGVEDARLQNSAGVGHVIGNSLNNHITIDSVTNAVDDPDNIGDDRGLFFEQVPGARFVSGGDGNDTIEGGGYARPISPGVAVIYEGNAGNDSLIGTIGADAYNARVYLRGGSGVDTLKGATSGVMADYANHAGPVSVDMSTGRFTSGSDVDVFVNLTGVRGTAARDTIFGDSHDNVLDGGAGGDDLGGGGGFDLVYYGDRATPVRASLDGARNDGTGGENDFIRSDVEGLIGGRANDTLVAGKGGDLLRGFAGDDMLYGGNGDDTLIGDDGNDLLDGNGGNDTARLLYYGLASRDRGDTSYITLDGKANDNDGTGATRHTDNVRTENVENAFAVIGDNGPNRLTNVGVVGNTFIDDHDNPSFALGGGGNDVLTDSPVSTPRFDGGAGADVITGGQVDYSSRNGINVSLDGVANDGSPGEGDNVTGTHVLYGTRGNDTLSGTDEADTLVGFGGNDRLVGFGGDDSLNGGSADLPTVDGNDTFVGGAGNDIVDYAARRNALTLRLDGAANDGASGEHDNIGSDIETLIGGYGNDTFVGDANNNLFFGGPGGDDFTGGGGIDHVSYLDNGFYTYATFEDSQFHRRGVTVTLGDNAANDGETGEHDNVRSDIERVTGTEGGDRLTAGATAATLNGFGGGTDTVTGGPGDDTLFVTGIARGLGGDDIFVNQNGQFDTIDGGDGFDSVQDDQIQDSTPGLKNDTFTNVEFVYDALETPASSLTAAAGPDAVVGARLAAAATSRLVLNGTAETDTITLTQSGTTVKVTINGKSTSYSTGSFSTLEIDALGGNDTVELSGMKIGVRVRGGTGNDRITGGAGNDQLAGELGNDLITGNAGNDIVSGGFIVLRGESVPTEAKAPDGNDTVHGGAGATDIVTYTYRTAALSMDMTGGKVRGPGGEADTVDGAEYIVAGQANDAVKGSTVNDSLFGGPGNDALSGGAGADRLLGGFGHDTINPDGGADYLDTGGDDNSDDDIIGLLDDKGFNPRNKGGTLLTGAFDGRDLFTLSGRRFGTPKR